jgi:hypothetical protein
MSVFTDVYQIVATGSHQPQDLLSLAFPAPTAFLGMNFLPVVAQCIGQEMGVGWDQFESGWESLYGMIGGCWSLCVALSQLGHLGLSVSMVIFSLFYVISLSSQHNSYVLACTYGSVCVCVCVCVVFLYLCMWFISERDQK